MNNVEDKKFIGWMWALKLVAVSLFKFSTKTTFDPVSWKIYYDEGLTVIEALQEDFKQL